MARLIQAGDDFATAGERRAAEELRKLPDNWTVIANKILPASHGRSFEIDFIVLGERLVFAIDEKSWTGRIYGSDAIWVRDDGSSERSPLGKLDYVAKILAGYLRAKVPRFAELSGHPVVGCVLLTRSFNRPVLRDPRAADGVLLLTEVNEALIRRDAQGDDPRVGALRQRIEETLFDLSHRPKFPRAIGPYAITEVASRPAGAYILRAAHAESGPRVLTRAHRARPVAWSAARAPGAPSYRPSAARTGDDGALARPARPRWGSAVERACRRRLRPQPTQRMPDARRLP